MKGRTGIALLIIGFFLGLLILSNLDDEKLNELSPKIKNAVDDFTEKVSKVANDVSKTTTKDLGKKITVKLDVIKNEYDELRELPNSDKLQFLESKLLSLQDSIAERKDIFKDKLEEDKEEYIELKKEIDKTSEIQSTKKETARIEKKKELSKKAVKKNPSKSKKKKDVSVKADKPKKAAAKKTSKKAPAKTDVKTEVNKDIEKS